MECPSKASVFLKESQCLQFAEIPTKYFLANLLSSIVRNVLLGFPWVGVPFLQLLMLLPFVLKPRFHNSTIALLGQMVVTIQ
jgi:hypothetical protein